MMGAGIAYSCARAGMEVVLKDVAVEAAEKGKAYTREAPRQGRRARQDHRRRRRPSCSPGSPPTADPADLAGLRPRHRGGLRGPGAQGTRCSPRSRPYVNPDALLCSNTSTLPITELADGRRPARRTSSACTSSARSTRCRWSRSSGARRPPTRRWPRRYDVVQQIRKTPIVVNDSRGFYTSRVIGTMVNEGLAMLAEGVHPMSLERAATQAGYPVGTAAAHRRAQHGADGQDRARRPRTPPSATARRTPSTRAARSSTRMIEARPAVAAQGRRLLRVRRDGKRRRLWPGLAEEFPVARRAAAVRRRQGPDAVHRGARDREVLRGGRHRVVRRGQHRLDHGHRLPGATPAARPSS